MVMGHKSTTITPGTQYSLWAMVAVCILRCEHALHSNIVTIWLGVERGKT
jgi:hypothetical protein